MKWISGFLLAGLIVVGCGTERELPSLHGRSEFRPSFLGGTKSRHQVQKTYPCPEAADKKRRNQGRNIDRLVEFNCFGTKSSKEARDHSAKTYNVLEMVAPDVEQSPQND